MKQNIIDIGNDDENECDVSCSSYEGKDDEEEGFPIQETLNINLLVY